MNENTYFEKSAFPETSGNAENLVIAAIAGKTNAGKSSLMNLLIGTKTAIVSNKPQTTRVNIKGIITKGNTQYVFVDTPGLHKPKSGLSSRMLKSARAGAGDCDVMLFLSDATRGFRYDKFEKELLDKAKRDDIPVVLLLNKCDLLKDKSLLLPVINMWRSLYNFYDIVPISVKKLYNIDLILPICEKFACEAPHIFDDEAATDQSEKFFLCELMREQLLQLLREEIPHGTAVQIEEIIDNKQEIEISFVIICEKQSHKGIIIGKNGDILKKAGIAVRKQAEEYFEKKVRINSFVKVVEDWRNKESMIKEYFDDGIAEKFE